jgi:uncharacterized protein YecE (DUF72 family)
VKLACYSIARVAATARVPKAAMAGGASQLVYLSPPWAPQTYYSAFEPDFLSKLATHIAEADADEIWCIFDNTASGAAVGNALDLKLETQLHHLRLASGA